MKIANLAIIQARLGSTRLPGKVLLPLAGRPVLRWVIDRLRQAGHLDGILVATTREATDDPIVEQCRQWQVPCFRGNSCDVLGRFHAATCHYGASWIVRVNADNPLTDPRFVDRLLEAASAGGADYISYQRADHRPVMLTALSFFTEAITASALARADRLIVDSAAREHVTLGVYSRPDLFTVRFLPVPASCDDPDLRFTLDTPEDLALLRDVYATIGPRAETISAEEVVELARGHPDWKRRMRQQNLAQPKTSGLPARDTPPLPSRANAPPEELGA